LELIQIVEFEPEYLVERNPTLSMEDRHQGSSLLTQIGQIFPAKDCL